MLHHSGRPEGSNQMCRASSLPGRVAVSWVQNVLVAPAQSQERALLCVNKVGARVGLRRVSVPPQTNQALPNAIPQ